MIDLALDVLAVALVLGAVAAIKWLRRPAPAAPTRLSFDEHAATAAALLQPDAPIFTDAEQAAIDEIADMLLADEVDDFLARLFPPLRPAVPHEES